MTTGVNASPPPINPPQLQIGSRDRALAIAAAISTVTFAGVALSLSVPLLSLILEDMNTPDWLIGASAACAGVAALVATPMMPRLVQRYGAIPLVLTAIAATILSFAAFYLYQNVWVWFPLRLVYAFALTIIFVISEFWINSLAPENKRGLIMGIYASALSLGFAAGPAILSLTGSRGIAPFGIGIILFSVASIPVYLARHSAPVIEAEHRSTVWPFIFAVPMATGAVFVFAIAESAGFAFLPLYGERLGLSESAAVTLVTLMSLGGLFVHVPIGMIADRMDRRFLLLICGFIGFVGILALPLVMSLPIPRTFVLMAWGGIAAGLYTVGLTHLGSRFRGGDLASANAAFVFMYALGMLVGPAAVGAALDIWDPHGLIIVLAAAFGLFLLLAVWRIRAAAAQSDKS